MSTSKIFIIEIYIFILIQMIRKRNANAGINANVSLEPSAASQSTSNINNNIIINKRDDGKEDIVITRDIGVDEQPQPNIDRDVRTVILETYAQILLNQDKALLSNLISRECIIVPMVALQNIIKSAIHTEQVDIYLDEDIRCCAGKANPIRRIEAIKIVNDNGEIVTDFKQVYNKEYNELVNVYHLCLKYCINM